jgi:phosphatidylcholine synthase
MYFSDGGMKTEDYSFRGFPGCWNMVVIVFFGLTPPDWVILSVTTVLAIAMFLPIKFIHPTRTKRWRVVSLPMGAFWTICAGWAAWVSFDPQSWAHYGLMITSIYLLLAGAAQQLIPTKSERVAS